VKTVCVDPMDPTCMPYEVSPTAVSKPGQTRYEG